MTFRLTLLDLAGMVALLLWGVRMVQTGIQRGFGPRLRQILGAALGNRFKAFAAGLGVTGNSAEQHCDRPDDRRLRRRRTGGPGAGAGGDAGRQCRHHADRAVVVRFDVTSLAPAVLPDRRADVRRW